jgi:hypothetical protein
MSGAGTERPVSVYFKNTDIAAAAFAGQFRFYIRFGTPCRSVNSRGFRNLRDRRQIGGSINCFCPRKKIKDMTDCRFRTDKIMLPDSDHPPILRSQSVVCRHISQHIFPELGFPEVFPGARG